MIDTLAVVLIGCGVAVIMAPFIWILAGFDSRSTEAKPQRMLLCHGPSGQFLHLNIDEAERLMRSFEDGDEWTATWMDLDDAIETIKDLSKNPHNAISDARAMAFANGRRE